MNQHLNLKNLSSWTFLFAKRSTNNFKTQNIHIAATNSFIFFYYGTGNVSYRYVINYFTKNIQRKTAKFENIVCKINPTGDVRNLKEASLKHV